MYCPTCLVDVTMLSLRRRCYWLFVEQRKAMGLAVPLLAVAVPVRRLSGLVSRHGGGAAGCADAGARQSLQGALHHHGAGGRRRSSMGRGTMCAVREWRMCYACRRGQHDWVLPRLWVAYRSDTGLARSLQGCRGSPARWARYGSLSWKHSLTVRLRLLRFFPPCVRGK